METVMIIICSTVHYILLIAIFGLLLAWCIEQVVNLRKDRKEFKELQEIYRKQKEGD